MSEHTDRGDAFAYRRIILRRREWKMLASSHVRIAMTRIYVWEILPKSPAVSLRSALLLTRQFQEKRSRQTWQLEREQTIATLGYQAPPKKSSENRIKDYTGYCWLSLPTSVSNSPTGVGTWSWRELLFIRMGGKGGKRKSLEIGRNTLVSYLIIGATVNSSFKNAPILDTFTSRGWILHSWFNTTSH